MDSPLPLNQIRMRLATHVLRAASSASLGFIFLLAFVGASAAPMAQVSLPLTFEENIDYEIVGFAGAEQSEIVTDPADPSNNVVRVTRAAGSETYAGTVVANNGLQDPIPFAAGATTMSVRVWTPVAGTPVVLKVEQAGNGAVAVESQPVLSTVGGAYETLVFDFAAPAVGSLDFSATYNKLVVFFDFGTAGAGGPYYFDDIAFGSGEMSGPSLVINEVDADTPGADTAEFVELYNAGDADATLDGHTIVFFNGNGDVSYAAFDLTGTLAPGEYYVLGNPGVANVNQTFDPGANGLLQNGADAVALYTGAAADFPNGTAATADDLVDAIVYGTDDADDADLLAVFGQATQYDEAANEDKDNQSIQRSPDGADTYVVASPTPGAANALVARLQVIHNSPDPAADTVDVYVNDALFLDDIAFREATAFMGVPAGVALSVDITASDAADSSSPVFTAEYTLDANAAYQLIATGVVGTGFSANPDGVSTDFTLLVGANAQEMASATDMVDVRVVHGAPDAPTVDVRTGGTVLVDDASYQDVTDYVSVMPDSYALNVTTADGSTVVGTYFADLSAAAGGAVTVLASGFLTPDDDNDGPAFGLLAVFPDGTAALLTLPDGDYVTGLSGANERPNPVNTNATGTAIVNVSGTTVTVTGSFSGLRGAYQASHIHRGAADETGDVVLTLTATVQSNNRGGVWEAANNTFTVSESFADSIKAGLAYVNVHSSAFPAGEIRGQTGVAGMEPDPATPLNLNGSFEEPETGIITDLTGGVPGWIFETGSSVTTAPEYAIVDAAYDGDQSLAVTVNTAGSNPWDIQAIADAIPVTPDSTYEYSVWARAENDGATVNFTVGNYAFAEYGRSTQTLTTEWQRFSFEFTVTDDETTVRAPIHFSAAGNVGNTIYIDKLVIRPAVETMTVAEARTAGVGETVTVEGTVTRSVGAFTYIQDATGGLAIRQTSGDFFDDADIMPGAEVRVTGELSEFASLLQINGSDLMSYEVLGMGDVPEPQSVTLSELASNGEDYEAELVTVTGVTFAATGTFAAATTYQVTDDSDQSNAVSVRVPNADDTTVDGEEIPVRANLTGIVGQFNFDVPTEGYQLLLLDAADIENSTAGEQNETTELSLAVANPLRGDATVRFSLDAPGNAQVALYDALGRRVLVVAEGEMTTGAQTVRLEAGQLASGVYILRLEAETGAISKTITVVR